MHAKIQICNKTFFLQSLTNCSTLDALPRLSMFGCSQNRKPLTSQFLGALLFSSTVRKTSDPINHRKSGNIVCVVSFNWSGT